MSIPRGIGRQPHNDKCRGRLIDIRRNDAKTKNVEKGKQDVIRAASMEPEEKKRTEVASSSSGIIGEIVGINVPEHCIGEDGSIDINSANTVALSGLDSYYRTTRVRRMAYAKPDLPPRVVD